MRKLFLFLVLFLPLIGINAQDIIIKRDGSEINCTVLKITSEQDIIYHLESAPDIKRSLAAKEVVTILYGGGIKETFDSPLRWVFGVDLKVVFPSDEIVSEVYGCFPGSGLRTAYFWNHFGLEAEYIFLKNAHGKPINHGNVIASSSCMKYNLASLSAYWVKTFPSNHTLFLGAGLGFGNATESFEISFGSRSLSAEEKFATSEAHATIGMVMGHFGWEVKSSNIASEITDKDLGGLSLSMGLRF